MQETIIPHSDIINQISRFPLFSELSPMDMEKIITKFHKNIYERGELIFKENSVGDKFYLIVSGKLEVSKQSPEGEKIVLSHMSEGEGFGEMALLNPNKNRSATVTAMQPTILLELNKGDFDIILQEYQDLHKVIKKLEEQRVSLSEDFVKDKKQGYQSKFDAGEIPILDLLFKLNKAAGGREQVEHCKETAILAKEMSDILCPYLSEDVQLASYLHEVGKISLDEKLVRKHRRGEDLTEEELSKTKDYPRHTVKIIGSIESLKEEVNLIRSFQEDDYRLMPLGAQILRVANDYQEMIHKDYMNMSSSEALKMIEEKSGTIYNPMVIVALEKILERVQTINVRTQLMYLDIINSALDSKDSYTGKHSRDTTRIAMAIGKKMKLSKQDLSDLEFAGHLHDIGKIKVPDTILNAPRKLEPWEFEIIKKHPIDSALFFDDIPGFEIIANIIKYHHEKYSGGGYPDGLTGENIPLLSRILAVADVFSALTTERVYRRDEKGQKKAFSKEKALEIMESMVGHFDPDIFKIFKEIIPEL